MIRGIKLAGIPVRDQDVSLKFYTEQLGFKVGTDQPFNDKQRWIELIIPGSEARLALFTPPGHEDRIGGFQSITFWCEDVFATAKLLKSKGVEFTVDPKAEVWGTMAIFKDPSGNQFCLSSR
jgi:catechol 2,3-dioxygenase-like lactoylglutathione lyase family enzyme